MLSLISIKKSALRWIISWISLGAAHASATPYAHYRMADSAPTSNGGNNLPYDSSGKGWLMTNAAGGTPAMPPTGGPSDDAYYTFNGSSQFFCGTADGWNPPEDNVGVEVWVRTSNLSQVNQHIFGTADSTTTLQFITQNGNFHPSLLPIHHITEPARPWLCKPWTACSLLPLWGHAACCSPDNPSPAEHPKFS